MKTTCKLSDEQVQELQALENHPVDFTDIPQTTDFSKARLKYYTVKPVKQSITLYTPIPAEPQHVNCLGDNHPITCQIRTSYI